MRILEQITIDLEQKGWSFQPNVLSADELAFISYLFEVEFVPARVGKGENLHRDESIRGDYTAWIDLAEPPSGLGKSVQFIHELQKALNRKLFLGIQALECHLAKYPVGAHYSRHWDRHSKQSTRVVSFIFYLHQEWTQEDGGELVLYDKNGKLLETIVPSPGGFICFMSGDFPHEVLRSKKERRSLTGWMHTKNI